MHGLALRLVDVRTAVVCVLLGLAISAAYIEALVIAGRAALKALVERVVLVAAADLAYEVGVVIGIRDARLDVFVVPAAALLSVLADFLGVGPAAAQHHGSGQRETHR